MSLMSSWKQPHGKTIEVGHLQTLQKLINNSQWKNKRNQCSKSVLTSDIDKAKVSIFRLLAQCVVSFKCQFI